jgi:hypothetical protein
MKRELAIMESGLAAIPSDEVGRLWEEAGAEVERGSQSSVARVELLRQKARAQQVAVAAAEAEGWRANQWSAIRRAMSGRSLRTAALRWHLFLGHRQIGGGAQVDALNEKFERLGLKCWYDLSQSVQNVDAMIRGVAESAVYMLYLTSDALSYFVTVEARVAMLLEKPVILLVENDSRRPTYYGGGPIENATKGWPPDLVKYFGDHARYIAWGGTPFEWSRADQRARLETVLKRCMAVDAPVPAGCAGWDDALATLLRPESEAAERARGARDMPAAVVRHCTTAAHTIHASPPEPEPEPEPEPDLRNLEELYLGRCPRLAALQDLHKREGVSALLAHLAAQGEPVVGPGAS